MLNKPIKIRKFAMLSMALFFWLSGISLFAQNKQTNTVEPEKKQVPSAQPKVSLSNQDPKAKKQNEVSLKKAAMEQKRKEEQASEAKKKTLAKEKAAASAVKQPRQVGSTSSKAPVTNATTSNSQSENFRKDWPQKKAKLEADLKAKGVPQEDIDKKIAAIEKKMNYNNQSTK